MHAAKRQAFFIDSMGHQLAVSQTGSASKARAALLIIPPLLEEMNASRHLASRLAEELADNWLTIQADLYGTGESDGELSKARLAIWQRNIEDLMSWARSQYSLPLHLLVIRTGALLLPEVKPPIQSVLGWHPIWRGDEWYKPIRRLTRLQAQSSNDSILDYAGYTLATELVEELIHTELTPLTESTLSLYVESMSPASSDLSSAARIKTAPFWIHNELPILSFSEWLRSSTDYLNQQMGGLDE